MSPDFKILSKKAKAGITNHYCLDQEKIIEAVTKLSQKKSIY